MSLDFDAAVEPYRSSLSSMVALARRIRQEHGYLADANSEAMDEIAEEARYRHDWSQEPVMGAHSWAGILLAAAEDHILSICRLVVGEPSLFGPQCLARASLEAAGRSEWFTESGIGVRRRVARWQTERLHNLYQLKRLGKLSPSEAADRAKVITGAARSLGFDILQGRRRPHPMIQEDRPAGAEVFRRLLVDATGENGLGHTMFAYLSANDHATVYGLMQSMSEHGPPTPDGRVLGHMSMDSHATTLLLAVVTIGYLRSVQSHRNLMGWTDQAWTKSAQNAVSLAFGVTQAPKPQ